MKRIVAFVLALALVLMAAPCALAAREDGRPVEGNTFKLTTPDDFGLGTLTNVEVAPDVGDGALVLSEGTAEGEFLSDIIETEPFEYLVASWNAYTPAGTSIEVAARVYVDMLDKWSGWMSWGVWGSARARASADTDSALAYVDTDILTVKGSSGETASLVQLRVTFKGADGETPVLRQVAATYKNTLDGQAIEPLYLEEAADLPASVILDTPAYSQMIREPSIASEMCSAVTVCTLLNDRGEDLLPEEVALLGYDFNYEGFGNWPYSVAVAGTLGYEGYVQYASFDILKQELAKGYSVGISVHYSSSANGGQTYLENGAANNTNGHLITITGYETVDGVDYFYSSDSAASGDENCLRRYRADQLDDAWSNRLAYIIHGKEDAGTPVTGRVSAELVPTDDPELFTLTVDGETVDLTDSFAAKKLRTMGGGMTAYTVLDEDGAPMPDTVKTTAANGKIRYNVHVENGDLVKLPVSTLLDGFTSRELRVYIMVNDGTTYVADVTLTAPEAPAESAAPEETPVPAAPDPTADVAASDTPAEEPAKTSPTIWLIAGAAVIVVAIIIIGVARKGKGSK